MFSILLITVLVKAIEIQLSIEYIEICYFVFFFSLLFTFRAMIVYTSQKSKILFNDLTLDLGHERKKDNKNTKHTTKSYGE